MTTLIVDTKTMTDKKEIVFFKKMCDYTLDEYWIAILTACSENKFPKGIYYNQERHSLYASKTDHVLSKNPVDAFKQIIHLFTTKAGMKSPHDIKLVQEQNEKIRETKKEYASWGNATKRCQKDALLQKYASAVCKKAQVPPARLIATINMGILLKAINPKKDMTFRDNRLVSIAGIQFNSKKRDFYIDRDIPPIPYEEPKKDDGMAKALLDYQKSQDKKHTL
jgi:hypothetical protein